jgi:hypothetical protein
MKTIPQWYKGEVLVEFPRKSQGTDATFGPFSEDGSLDGMLVKIGGMDETVPVLDQACTTARVWPDIMLSGHAHLYER